MSFFYKQIKKNCVLQVIASARFIIHSHRYIRTQIMLDEPKYIPI